MDSTAIIVGDCSLGINAFHTGTELHTAAVNGDKSTIERLLKQQDVGDTQALNKGDRYGRTALVYTVFGEWYECAEILVRHGASVLQADSDKRSVLHWAAYLARPKFIKLFLEHVSSNLDWNFGDKDGRTALHYAAMQPNPKCLRLLLKRLTHNKRSINTTDDELMTALHWSVFYNRLENFKLLIRESADTTKRDVKGRCLLHMTVLNPNEDSVRIVRLLLKLNRHFSRHVDCQKRTALHLAVANGNEELVRELCAAEESALKDLDNFSRNVLHYAVVKNNLNIINILISAGVSPYDVDNTGASVLHYAAKHNNVQILKRLLFCFKSLEDSADKQGRTALMWAACEGSTEVLNVMVQHLSYFNIHASDEQGLTALHFACFAGHVKCARLLIANSADINQPDKLGQTALFKACQQGHRKIIDILMDNTEYRGTIGEDRGLMDNEGSQITTEQGILNGNTTTLGTHLFSIQEEPTGSSHALKHSGWSHETNSTDSVHEGVKRQVDEMGNLCLRDKGSFPGVHTSESTSAENPKRLEYVIKKIPFRGQNSQSISSDFRDEQQFSGALTMAGVKPGIIPPRGDSSGELSPTNLGIHELVDDNGCTPLHFAAHAGHTSVCRWLLSQGVDPGKKDVQGRTALHGAAFNGHTECMIYMLSDHPELVNDRDNDGYSVLHHAAINGQLEAVKLLVSRPYLAFPNYRVKSTDWTPLDFAMAADHQDVTQFLMDNGALTILRLQDLAADTIKRFLQRLIIQRHEAKLKPLIERHRKLTREESLKHRENEDKMRHVTKDDVTDTNDIVENDGKNYVIGLVDTRETEYTRRETVTGENRMNSDLKSDDNQLMAESDQLRTCSKSNEGINSDFKSENHRITADLLRTSTKSKNKIISDFKSEDDRFTEDADHLRTFTKSENKIKSHFKSEDNRLTWEHNRPASDSDQPGTFTKSQSTTNSDLKSENNRPTVNDDQLRTFTSLFGEIGTRDHTNHILLLNACYHGNLELVQKLLVENIDVNYRDENGCTALHFAAAQGHDTICGYLLEHGSDALKRDINGRTALHNASTGGHFKCISLLLRDYKELISYLDCDNRSALHYAASMGHLNAVKLLLSESNVIQNIRAKFAPLTALDCAILGQHHDVIEFMISQGAQKSGTLDAAASVIQNNFRKWLLQQKTGTGIQHEKPNEHVLVKNDLKSKTGQNETKSKDTNAKVDFVKEISSGIQKNTTYSTSEMDQNFKQPKTDPITKESENFSEALTSDSDARCQNSQKLAINPLVHSKHLLNPNNGFRNSRAKDCAPLSTTSSLAKSDIENLSRAPDSVVVASSDKEKIFQLRNDWERIALLRRKKQAALVIQRYFRIHLETTKLKDKDDSKKASDVKKSEDIKAKNKSDLKFKTQNDHFHNSRPKLHENQPESNRPFPAQKAVGSDKPTDENFSNLNTNEPSPGIHSHNALPPRRLIRKTVGNRLRTASYEQSNSENEHSREKRQYRSTFPLLSPKSSSTSSNGLSPSNQTLNQLANNKRANRSPSNRHLDVAPILWKDEFVSKWLSENSPQQEVWSVGNSIEGKNSAQSEPAYTTPRSARTIDPSNRATTPVGLSRRLSTHSACVRRTSLVKDVYGSPAALSFNFALDAYHPLASRRGRKDTAFPYRTSSRVRPNSMKRVKGGWVHTADCAVHSATNNES